MCHVVNAYRDYSYKFLIFKAYGLQDSHEDDWYNKSLRALGMSNPTSHPGLSNPVLQYQT